MYELIPHNLLGVIVDTLPFNALYQADQQVFWKQEKEQSLERRKVVVPLWSTEQYITKESR